MEVDNGKFINGTEPELMLDVWNRIGASTLVIFQIPD